MEDHRGTVRASAWDDGLDLTVHLERHDGPRGRVHVLSLAGDLDVVGAARLRQRLPDDEAHLLVADLAGVAFLDSSGIGALIALHRRAVAGGGSFVLCCAQPQPRQVLGHTGADTLLTVRATLAEALAPERV